MIYAFGTFAFDDVTLELTREGRRVALEPQPARALARLLAGAGALVTREELRAAVWGEHTHVDYDRGLAYCIGQVRTALGDSGDNPRFVQTLPKRGFRFVAPVAPVATVATAATVVPAATVATEATVATRRRWTRSRPCPAPHAARDGPWLQPSQFWPRPRRGGRSPDGRRNRSRRPCRSSTTKPATRPTTGSCAASRTSSSPT